MTELFLRSVFADNLILSFFLGVCTFLAVSKRLDTAVGLGIAMIVVQTITVPLNQLLHTGLLVAGAWAWLGLPEVDLSFLKLLAFIGVIAATVQVLEMVLDRHFPALYRALGIYLPLITVNCAILGGSLFMVERRYDFAQSVVFGVGGGIGWALAIVALAAIRERLRYADVPAGLRGLGIAFIVTGLMSMGFMAFGAAAAAMTEIVLATLLLTALLLALSLLVMGARRIFVPSLPVVVTVNGKAKVDGKTGDKLLAMLDRGGITVPSACAGAGTCGLCRVRVAQGAGEALPIERARMSAGDIAHGMRLACQVVVREALAIELPADMLAAERWGCTVVSSTMLAPLIKELVLQLPADAAFSFRAGAFVQVSAPAYELDFAQIEVAAPFDAAWRQGAWRGLKVSNDTPLSRAYSVANRPADTALGRIVLDVRLAVPPPSAGEGVPPGIVSSYLFNARAGQRIDVAGPFGDFGVQSSEREMIMIAGGVGMAPFRAIIFDELERKRSQRKMSFWYGARRNVEVFYADEFSELARQHPNFSWTVALSDPDPALPASGPVGFVHEVVYRTCLKDHPAPHDCEYYLCGPPMMIQAVMRMLDDLGVERDSIFFDDFGS